MTALAFQRPDVCRDWPEQALLALARAWPPRDTCPRCEGQARMPFKVRPAANGIAAFYRCPHGHEWRSDWAARDPLKAISDGVCS